MILILASRWDKAAVAVAARCRDSPVRIMTCRDLCMPGWRQHLGAGPADTAVAAQHIIAQRAVTGVLTRLPSVTEDELSEVAPPDRGYVAAEMTAFLLFWLTRLSCPVLNRPTSMCLAGPFWRPEQWVHAAARAGIRVQSVHRDTHPKSRGKPRLPAMSRAVTVIGRHMFGDADLTLRQAASCLAQLADVAMLTVHFSGAGRGAAFLRADTFPDLGDDRLKDAAFDTLRDPPARHA